MTTDLSIKEYFSYFRDRRLIAVFVFGMASGFPWLVIGSVLSAWLKDEGLSRSAIGLFGIVFGAYSINFLWAPLLDRVKLPVLTKLMGLRRSWILLAQCVIVVATLGLATLDIQNQLYWVAFLALVIAAAGATQDIAIDAFRIDTLSQSENNKVTAAAAMATSGWWSGYALLGVVPFYLADLPGLDWSQVYFFLAAIMLLLCSCVFFVSEPNTQREHIQRQLEKQHISGLNPNSLQRIQTWIAVTFIAPFSEFFKRNGIKTALALLAFIFLFKIGEAFLGRMSIVFYKEIGFSNAQIGFYSKFGTGVITILFAFLGSLFNHRYGIVKGLMISGIAMAASNLIFSYIALVGPKEHLYATAVVVDGFTQAWSLVAMVAFISMLTNRSFTATQYALLVSLGNLSRALLSSWSGYLVDWLNGDWAVFFVLTSVMVIPSLIFLWLIRHKLYAIESKGQQA